MRDVLSKMIVVKSLLFGKGAVPALLSAETAARAQLPAGLTIEI